MSFHQTALHQDPATGTITLTEAGRRELEEIRRQRDLRMERAAEEDRRRASEALPALTLQERDEKPGRRKRLHRPGPAGETERYPETEADAPGTRTAAEALLTWQGRNSEPVLNTRKGSKAKKGADISRDCTQPGTPRYGTRQGHGPMAGGRAVPGPEDVIDRIDRERRRRKRVASYPLVVTTYDTREKGRFWHWLEWARKTQKLPAELCYRIADVIHQARREPVLEIRLDKDTLGDAWTSKRRDWCQNFSRPGDPGKRWKVPHNANRRHR